MNLPQVWNRCYRVLARLLILWLNQVDSTIYGLIRVRCYLCFNQHEQPSVAEQISERERLLSDSVATFKGEEDYLSDDSLALLKMEERSGTAVNMPDKRSVTGRVVLDVLIVAIGKHNCITVIVDIIIIHDLEGFKERKLRKY